MPLTSLLGRTYLRYAIPMTLLSALAFAPLLFLAFKLKVPPDAAHAKGVMRTAWLLVGTSIVPLLILVGGVAPAVRAVVAGAPISQLAALRHGVAGLVHAVVPCLLAILAVVIGSLALVIPGLVLLVLLSLTGAVADRDQDLPTRLALGVGAARASIVSVTVILVVSIGFMLLAVYFLQRGLPIPLPKKPAPELLPSFQLFARYAIIGIAIAAPLPAIALAAIAARARP